MLTANIIYINDPGHGWLRVPLADMKALGPELCQKISPYSFATAGYAYLEEDMDATTFLEERKKHEPAVEITERYVGRFNRDLPRFDTEKLQQKVTFAPNAADYWLEANWSV